MVAGAVFVKTAVFVGTGVLVGTGVFVGTGVLVGGWVTVTVCEMVAVGVMVAVIVGVIDGVTVIVSVRVGVLVRTWAADRAVLPEMLVEDGTGGGVIVDWAAAGATDQTKRPHAMAPAMKLLRIHFDIPPRLSGHVVTPFDEESPYIKLRNGALCD